MSQLRVHNVSMSLDGFMAGPDQSLDDPLGVGAQRLHEWIFATRTFRAEQGLDGGTTGVDDAFVARGEAGIGATIIGRNMFGPVRGDWESWADTHGGEAWTGWWGEDPPYHHPVFVLTHHPRPPLTMAGGTTFHFVYDGVDDAYAEASDAAGDLDVRLGGGASTIQQFLAAGLVDEIHVALVPLLLGAGERLFGDLGAGAEDFACVEMVASSAVTHIRLARRG
ncbi:RibD C-terminal domain-containing protein [Sanguibacter gelidistatuariae]|uniref:RibD C-terminal domain-containing protein n=1 Tax=Sanguibacter gelidistatuariae TaxID=1814289 RepID=A0A1G6WVW2_9MICO|nr:dihydrofolate reductase family protein [Sanguibacter gelidistatuariae]SDD70090.1 RibD C-terminal domain-containing protein [Sanguibacter gelidistatuariae]